MNTTQTTPAAEFIAAVTAGESDPGRWRTAAVATLLTKLAMNWDIAADPDGAATVLAINETLLLMRLLEQAVRTAQVDGAHRDLNPLSEDERSAAEYHRAVASYHETCQN